MTEKQEEKEQEVDEGLFFTSSSSSDPTQREERRRPPTPTHTGVHCSSATLVSQFVPSTIRSEVEAQEHSTLAVDTLLGPMSYIDLTLNIRQDTHGIATDTELTRFNDELKFTFSMSIEQLRGLLPQLLAFYIVNGASQQINPDYGFFVNSTKYRHRDVLGAATRAGVTLRAVLRRYADLARAILIANPNLQSKAFQKLSISESYRTVAFDFADGCRDPPLSPLEADVVRRIRHAIIPRSQYLSSQPSTPRNDSADQFS
jgi:hypothetical protein